MQLIGIYLRTHGNPVSKNLKENWYPFGNFDNCHGVKDFSNILKQVKENQTFINEFYNVRQGSGENKPSINLNCIVGKNGSRKSSVLSLLYRIINNLACKLKEILPDYNKDYSPIWAWGLNPELYYEMDGKLGCIEIFDNDKPLYTEKRAGNMPVRLVIHPKEEDLLSRKPKKTEEKKFLEKLGKSIFYTIGTNYSLYTNSVVRFDYDESQENWMNTIYHKNDGYFTPIVLVPYRNYNGKNSIIDTEKELRLANERVNTLSILLKVSDGSAFVEGFLPKKVIYELKKTILKKLLLN
ncbi:MAG: ATP-binding protein [Treponema sp.]|nr:ATP-binding protein [Treponema sp.]